MHKIISAVLAVALISSAAAVSAAPAATSAKQRFTLHFKEVNGKQQTTLLTAIGPISGHGTETQKERPGGVYLVTLHLKAGLVRVRAVEKRPTMHIDLAKCRGTAKSTGTFKITGGTGAYSATRGHGTLTDDAVIAAARDNAGRCLGPQSGTQPKSRVDTLKMVGTAAR